MRWVLLGLVAVVAACGSDPSSPTPTSNPGGEGGAGGMGGGETCPSPHRIVDGQCRAPGQQDDGCFAGELLVDGSCVAAGVAPQGCPSGFELATDRCVPVIVEDCPEGLMAPPGETTCRPPMACGTGTWGDIPVEPNTVYVDPTYPGGDSDGTATKPFTSVGAGISAANDGAIVAVAEGTYSGILFISKPVRVWGVCPSKVRFEPSTSIGALLDAPGAELHGITMVGAPIVTGNVEDILIEGVHVVDSPDIGILVGGDVQASVPAAATIRSTLVERGERAGIIGFDSSVVVEGSVVRDISANEAGLGAGIGTQQGLAGLPASLTVRHSLITGAVQAGIFTVWTDVELESVAILDVVANPNDDVAGFGLALQAGDAPSTAVVDGLYVRNTETGGVYLLGSSAVMTRVTVESIAPNPAEQLHGNGVIVAPIGSETSSLDLSWSVVEDTSESGIAAIDAAIELSACVIRSTAARPDGLFGHGVTVEGSGSTLTMTSSVIADHVALGVLVDGAEATITGTAIRDIVSSPEGLFGDGALIGGLGGDASLTVTASAIANNERAGLTAFGAGLSLESTDLACNAIPLVAESQGEVPATLTDLGGNRCDCGDEVGTCKAASATVSPPAALPEPPPLVSDG